MPALSHTAHAHPVIEPAPLTDDLIATIEAAVYHQSDLNRHATHLNRIGLDPAVAAQIYQTVTAGISTLFGVTGPLVDEPCLNCTVDSYVKHGLVHDHDHDAVEAAQNRIARLAVGFPADPTETELALLHHDPQSLVRAAYAIWRRIDA